MPHRRLLRKRVLVSIHKNLMRLRKRKKLLQVATRPENNKLWPILKLLLEKGAEGILNKIIPKKVIEVRDLISKPKK